MEDNTIHKKSFWLVCNIQIWRLINRLRRALSESVEYTLPHMTIIVAISTIGFIAYYFIWQILFPQPYENLTLRIIGCILFIGFIFFQKWPAQLNRYLNAYWFITFTFALPFFFTFMLLKNDGNTVWAMSTMAGMTLLILLAHDWLLVIIMILVGISLSLISYILTTNTIAIGENYLFQIPVYLFLIIIGTALNYRFIRFRQEKAETISAIGVEIAHELRTPLLTIRSGLVAVNHYLPKLINSHKLAAINNLSIDKLRQDKINQLTQIPLLLEREVDNSNILIDMILMNLGKKINNYEFSTFSISNVIDKALNRYPFKSDEERKKILWDANQNDFYIWGSEILLMHVLFNLLKNSLIYIHKYGKGEISIKLEKMKNVNTLIFKDTAIGIPAKELSKVFDNFYTKGKSSEGNGVGLAFCKRVMRQFNGKIECDSKLNEYTEFTLKFPKLEKE